MPSYNIHITANTIDDHDPAALLEIVERVAAALRPALPYGTAIEDIHVDRDQPDSDPRPFVVVQAGDTIEIAQGDHSRTVRTVAVQEATDEQPAQLTVRGYGPRTVAEALKAGGAR